MTTHTLASIQALLLRNAAAVERAMVVLYELQTEGERAEGVTRERNGQGFNGFDAPKGTYFAKWVLSGRKLSGRHLEDATRMAIRYRGQLLRAAQAKALAGQSQAA